MAAAEKEKQLEEINAIMANKNHDDIYKQIVDSIMNNEVPWQQTWDSRIGNAIVGTPVSGASGRGYTGFNKLYLTYILNKLRNPEGHVDPRFYTFHQIKKKSEKGYHLVKGAHGCSITMYFRLDKDEFGNPLPLEEQRWLPRNAVVFHTSQIRQSVYVLDEEGNKIPLLDKDGNQRIGRDGELLYKKEDRPFPEYVPRFRPYNHEETNELIELLIKKSGAKISHDQGSQNFYVPQKDTLHLTPKGAYADINDYYRTTLHELCHWTGHESRLNRNLSGAFGSKEYAREELRAEIASAFICSDFNIPLSANHGAYLKNWLKKLENDPKEMEMAQRDAHRIINYINNLVRERVKELEAVRENHDSEYSDFNEMKKGGKSTGEKSENVDKTSEEKNTGEVNKDSEKEQPVGEKEKAAVNKIPAKLYIYRADKNMPWAGKSLSASIKAKIPIDFRQYGQAVDAVDIPDVRENITEYLIAQKGTEKDIPVRKGDVVKLADRLFYINKRGRLSNINENNFYQEVNIRNFKNKQIFAPLEGRKREQIKSEQIKQIGKEAFEAYRKQFRDVLFAGEGLSAENCADSYELQYKKFIYDHTFDYGISGIRPCDQKAWQKADSNFCIQVFENNMGDVSAMFAAINTVQQHSPYATANPEVDYSEELTSIIMKNPEYQKIKAAQELSRENNLKR